MKVVDASVAVKWFLEEHGRDAAMSLIRSGEVLIAPDFIVLEISNVLRRKQRQGSVNAKQVTDAIEVMTVCFSQLITANTVAQEAVRLSIELNHSVYDCAYLACAMMLDVHLVTADQVFATKAVAAIPDYLIQVI